MAALSVLRDNLRGEIGEAVAGRWQDARLNSWLNRAVDYCVSEFYRTKCWSLLRELTKYVTYTMNTSYTEYTMWDVINNETTSKGETNTNTWYNYVHGMLGNYVLHKATLKEYHQLIATYGEKEPSTEKPYIVTTGYDRTTKYLAYTVGYQPEQDGVLIGATGGAKARVAIDVPQASGAWGTTAAGYYYIYGDTGTFQAEQLDYRAPKGSSTISNFATIAAAAVTESHDNCPTFEIYPALTAADTLKIWFLNKPTAMSAATDSPDLPYDCDELLVLYATARAWKAEGTFERHAMFWQEFQAELQKKIQNFQEAVFNPVGFGT